MGASIARRRPGRTFSPPRREGGAVGSTSSRCRGEVTMPYRKKLIEVALPLDAINAESAREKSIRHGHPSTLQLWWARRPLAACRAVLYASLVDDPSDCPHFAADFEAS